MNPGLVVTGQNLNQQELNELQQKKILRVLHFKCFNLGVLFRELSVLFELSLSFMQHNSGTILDAIRFGNNSVIIWRNHLLVGNFWSIRNLQIILPNRAEYINDFTRLNDFN